MKKILITKNYTNGIEKTFAKLGYEMYVLNDQIETKEYQTIYKTVKEYHDRCNLDYVFTLDFAPDMAKVCSELGIEYISWVWDAPHAALWAKEAEYDTNYIFLFDYAQYQTHLQRGLSNIFYLPIAADIDNFEAVIEADGGERASEYGDDVTFVGNLYNDEKHNLYDKILYWPPYVKGYLEALIKAQMLVWGADLLDYSITDNVWNQLKQYVKMDVSDRYRDGFYEATFKNVIGQKIAQLERKEMCSYLAQRFSFTLFTDSDTSYDPVIRKKGHVDYLTQMPLVFRYSKINIHITSRNITSGVPLRVMDVLACKGFLITNYQPEIAEYFELGKELVVFNDFPDLYEKIDYYLAHEDERNEIAEAGYQKVCERFGYLLQIGKIKEVLEGNEEDSDRS